jgi:tripartite-type tricarboxylate transporter receptor subunit TctC
VLAPAGTPPAIVERLQPAIAKVVPTTAHREKLPAGALPLFLAKPESVAMMDADRAAYGSVVKRLNLRLD